MEKESDVLAYNNQIVDDAIRYIQANYCSDFKLKDVAYACNCNKNYLSSLFKKITGVTVSHYINSYRVTEAKAMICRGETRSSLIAMECGFNDSAYFSSIFKKYAGCTPNEYISKVQNNDD